MLSTVKAYIDDLPPISFKVLFVNYMISVQDSNIDYEFRRLTSQNIFDVKSIERLINETMEELV